MKTPVAPHERLAGVYAAVLTPFGADGLPDHGTLALHCRRLLADGCDGLAVLGTTGEANSLSVDERVEVLERLVASGIPGQALLPGTGCCALPDTVRLTEAAVKAGAPSVLMLPPFYYKTVSEDGVYAAFAEVIERVGDSRLRICLYHFPQMSGVPLSPALVERLQRAFPDTVVGLKDSSGDLDSMIATVRRVPALSVFTGSDEFLLPVLRAGGAGCITGVCNVAAPLAAQVFAAWRRGDDAAAMVAQARLTAVRKEFLAYPLSAALKEAIARSSGLDTWRNIRPPLQRLNDAQSRALQAALERTELDLRPVP